MRFSLRALFLLFALAGCGLAWNAYCRECRQKIEGAVVQLNETEERVRVKFVNKGWFQEIALPSPEIVEVALLNTAPDTAFLKNLRKFDDAKDVGFMGAGINEDVLLSVIGVHTETCWAEVTEVPPRGWEKAIGRSVSWKMVNCPQVAFTDETIAHLGGCRSLWSLSCSFSPESFRVLCRAEFSELRQLNCGFQAAEFGGPSLDTKWIANVNHVNLDGPPAAEVVRQWRTSSKLSSLTLRNSTFRQSDITFLEAATGLQTICVADCQIDADAFAYLLRNAPSSVVLSRIEVPEGHVEFSPQLQNVTVQSCYGEVADFRAQCVSSGVSIK